MKIRITGSAGECQDVLARVGRVLRVREVSGFYPNRGPSVFGRVYLDVDPPDSTATGTGTAPATSVVVPGGER